MRISHIIFSLLLLLLLQSCGFMGDRMGRELSDEEIAAIPDAVPKDEPLAETGNPDSYEINGRRYNVMKDSTGFVQHGIASWYGKKFHGRRTSSGEIYDMYQMTAAHKTLPLPSYVRVTNLANQRSVVLRVNDRGPFVQGRSIDLSYVAAKKLGVLGNGTAEVEIRALSPGQDNNSEIVMKTVEDMQPLKTEPIQVTDPVRETTPVPVATPPASTVITAPPVATRSYYLQVGAFSLVENAERMELKTQEILNSPVSTSVAETAKGTLYRVRVGPLYTREELILAEEELKRNGYKQFTQIIE